jgi:ABC-type polysaccharide/polyol phosphate export permease
VLSLNPMTPLLEAQRDVLVRGDVPSGWPLYLAFATSAGAGALGWWAHRRAAPTFLDYL